MAFVLNLLGLVIVLGLCWIAMMWLSKSFHRIESRERRQQGGHSDEVERQYSIPVSYTHLTLPTTPYV